VAEIVAALESGGGFLSPQDCFNSVPDFRRSRQATNGERHAFDGRWTAS
jgi:hypothetical protein